MNRFVLGICVLSLSAAPALACKGTAEYPATMKLAAQSAVTPEKKQEIMKMLEQGNALHEEGHKADDTAKMKKSMEMLEAIKKQIGN
jgi:hypothetical protein